MVVAGYTEATEARLAMWGLSRGVTTYTAERSRLLIGELLSHQVRASEPSDKIHRRDARGFKV